MKKVQCCVCYNFETYNFSYILDLVVVAKVRVHISNILKYSYYILLAKNIKLTKKPAAVLTYDFWKYTDYINKCENSIV